ncbi:MAG: bifunctional folylpolyglutamate synthase/dihydrofolate synthase [Culicoidibacterales bacterium]
MKFQTSKEVLSFFDQFQTSKIDLTLTRMVQALKQLGNPHNQYPTIHIGGTNGKGSTTSFLRNLLQAHGYTVATFTSPHIETFHERMQINGVEITDADLLETTNRVLEKLGTVVDTLGLTQFELMALVMFDYFAKRQPDFAVIEVGMGGRFDATNVITPLVSVITNVSLDHQAFLGADLATIALEKAGIIKPGVPFVTTSKVPLVFEILQAQAKHQGAPLYQFGTDFAIRTVDLQPKATQFDYRFGSAYCRELTIQLKGYHQVENASAALSVLALLEQAGRVVIDPAKLRQGLQATTWIGRMEQLASEPLTYVDGAHNEAGITQLCETIQTYFPIQTCHVIFCAMADKDVSKMIPQLEAVAKTLTLTSFDFPRAAAAHTLTTHSRQVTTQAINDFPSAYQTVKEQMDEGDVLIITGSLYFVAYVRKKIKVQ